MPDINGSRVINGRLHRIDADGVYSRVPVSMDDARDMKAGNIDRPMRYSVDDSTGTMYAVVDDPKAYYEALRDGGAIMRDLAAARPQEDDGNDRHMIQVDRDVALAGRKDGDGRPCPVNLPAGSWLDMTDPEDVKGYSEHEVASAFYDVVPPYSQPAGVDPKFVNCAKGQETLWGVVSRDASIPVQVLFNENDTAGEVRPLQTQRVFNGDGDGTLIRCGDNFVAGHDDLSDEPLPGFEYLKDYFYYREPGEAPAHGAMGRPAASEGGNRALDEAVVQEPVHTGGARFIDSDKDNPAWNMPADERRKAVRAIEALGGFDEDQMRDLADQADALGMASLTEDEQLALSIGNGTLSDVYGFMEDIGRPFDYDSGVFVPAHDGSCKDAPDTGRYLRIDYDGAALDVYEHVPHDNGDHEFWNVGGTHQDIGRLVLPPDRFVGIGVYEGRPFQAQRDEMAASLDREDERTHAKPANEGAGRGVDGNEKAAAGKPKSAYEKMREAMAESENVPNGKTIDVPGE